MNNKVVYRHIRLDTNEVFYIGIGTMCRANTKKGRSLWWKSIVGKTEYRVDILFDNLSWGEACEKEIEFIALYGRKDLGLGPLCNMTDGGEGQSNPSAETRIRIGASRVGKPLSEEHRSKISEGGKGRLRSEETKRKMSKAQMGNKKSLGYRHTDETKLKFSALHKGRKRSEETCLNIGKAKTKSVYQLTLDGLIINKWDSVVQAEREGGFSKSSISKVCRGVMISHKGYKWKYKDAD
jgi:hypothetical protein